MAAWDIDLEVEGVTSDNKLVAVAGEWNPLGLWLIGALLERGYRVRSVLSGGPAHEPELLALPGATENLQIFTADTLDYWALRKTFAGCSAVFLSTRSCEMLNDCGCYPGEYIDDAVKRSLNMVEACTDTASVKRIIYTSSASTIVYDNHDIKNRLNQNVVDERCWSNLDFCKKNKLWGAVCKILAEWAAWALAKDRGMDMVVINPATIIDAPTTEDPSAIPFSSHLKEKDAVIAYAHADEVTEAHIRAMENPAAFGRYLVFHRLLSNNESEELQKSDPKYARVWDACKSLSLSNLKVRNLGITV